MRTSLLAALFCLTFTPVFAQQQLIDPKLDIINGAKPPCLNGDTFGGATFGGTACAGNSLSFGSNGTSNSSTDGVSFGTSGTSGSSTNGGVTFGGGG